MSIRTLVPIAIAFAITGMTFHSSSASAKSKTLIGTVAYRERIVLPPSAAVEVRLLDVSRADAPSKTIARTLIRPAGQVPIPYRLRFDASKMEPRHNYALHAQITVDGQLWFTSTTHHPVFTGGTDKTDILVQRVSKSPSASLKHPTGRWLAEDIRGGGVIDRLQTVLEIAKDGAINGTGGCNRMSGKAVISGNTITFGSIASTKMACTPAAMDQEAKFFAALRDVRTWRIDPTRQKLVLLARGKAVIVLSKM